MAMRKLNPKDFYVGKMVPLRYRLNKARYLSDDSYRMATVSKIGRKYIHCGGIAFEIESGYEKSDYTANYQLYESEEALLEEIEAEKITDAVRTTFDYFSEVNLSIEQLRAIAEIIGYEVEFPRKQE